VDIDNLNSSNKRLEFSTCGHQWTLTNSHCRILYALPTRSGAMAGPYFIRCYATYMGEYMPIYANPYANLPTDQRRLHVCCPFLIAHTILAVLSGFSFRHTNEAIKRGSGVTLGIVKDLRIDIEGHARR
jgi:hypothetical protein